MMGVALSAWRLLVRRTLRARWSLVVLLAVATLLAVLPVSFAATVAFSGTAQGNDFADRLLGPYALRVQGDDAAEARDLAARADEFGATSTLVLATTGSVVTKTSAASGAVEYGRPDPGYLSSRFEMENGGWPAPGEVALSHDLATVLSVQPKDSVTVAGRSVVVSGIVRERAHHSARVVLDPLPAERGVVGDPARTTWNIFVRESEAGQGRRIEDRFLADGYGVLSRSRTDDDGPRSDGEFIRTMTTAAWGLAGLAAAMTALIVGLLTRSLRRDLAAIAAVGFGPRQLSVLVMMLWGAVGAPTVIVAAVGGVAAAVALRPGLEAAGGSSWYGVRIDPFVLIAVFALVALSAVGSAVAVTRPLRAHHMGPRVLGISGALVVFGAVETEQWTYLLAAALLLAPWVAMVSWPLLRAAARSRRSITRRPMTLLTGAALRTSPAAGPTMAALTAGLMVAPLTMGLVLSGMSESGRSTSALVPRASVAIYSGGGPFGAAELQSAAVEAGIPTTATWNLATMPTRTPEGDVMLPALPYAGWEACRAQSSSPSQAAGDLCSAALRGVGVAEPRTMGVILGRALTGDERGFFDRGGALVLDARLAPQGRVGLSSPSDSPGGVGTLDGRVVTPAAGTAVADTTPRVWVSLTAHRSAGLRTGQVQAAYDAGKPITPELEQRLRRGLVMRLPVSEGEEFLVTALDAVKVNVAQKVLAHAGEVAVVLAVVASVLGGLSFRRIHRHDVAVLADLGVPRSMIRTWAGLLAALSTAAGTAAAVAVAAAMAWGVIRGEIGADLTGAAVTAVLPVLLGPVVVFLVSSAWTTASIGTAWGLGFGHE